MTVERWVWPGCTLAADVDGDSIYATVTRDLGFHGQAVFRQKFRLARINTPKITTDAGKAAAARTHELLSAEPFTLESGKPYKFGGEWMADITLADGRNLSDTLVAEGLGVYWDGTGPRPADGMIRRLLTRILARLLGFKRAPGEGDDGQPD